MHITSSVFINDHESGLHHDYDVWLKKLALHQPIRQYRYNDTGEDNADAHLKRQVMGRDVVVAITNGHADFGPWEQIFYSEFDGNRRKHVAVKMNVHVIDVFSAADERPEYFSDGLHPNAVGNKAIAETVFTVIKQA
jgi:secondary thiamine-phosphate synthase enzyme